MVHGKSTFAITTSNRGGADKLLRRCNEMAQLLLLYRWVLPLAKA